MRLRTKIVGGGIALALLALAVWLAIPPGRTGNAVVITMNVEVQEGVPGPILRGWVTNNSPLSLVMAPPPGKALTASDVLVDVIFAEVVSQGNPDYTNSMPLGVIWPNPPKAWPANTPVQVYDTIPPWVGRISLARMVLAYSRGADPVRRWISAGVRRLPKSILPKPVAAWLFKNGLMDGRLRFRTETPWVSIPQNGV
jgi:hypothetical protein